MCKLIVEPGVCGFKCEIEVQKEDKRKVAIEIKSDCEQISKLNTLLNSIELRDVFKPPIKNVVFKEAEKSGCHASCPVPIAVLKCAEVEMGMAIPQNVTMNFSQ